MGLCFPFSQPDLLAIICFTCIPVRLIKYFCGYGLRDGAGIHSAWPLSTFLARLPAMPPKALALVFPKPTVLSSLCALGRSLLTAHSVHFSLLIYWISICLPWLKSKYCHLCRAFPDPKAERLCPDTVYPYSFSYTPIPFHTAIIICMSLCPLHNCRLPNAGNMRMVSFNLQYLA